ncbi:unnamed protein product [Orchesella dallaii]|uniref:Solute carrier organic anion transporter family member n=1 Tax=Orchesella dallaii TaxID=48710 RepID=A0ABP1QXB2_9HEXA
MELSSKEECLSVGSSVPKIVPSSESAVALNNMGENERPRSSPLYGWCSFTPSCIQFLVNKKAFLFVFCITCVLQGTFHTYFVAVITTLEKLFSIPSQVTGTLMMGSEIGQVSSALLLPYFVGQGHRPRWMAIGSSMFAIATLLCASPHVLIPLSVKLKATQDTQFCDITAANASLSCDSIEQDNPHFILFPIIFLSLLTIGCGQTAVYTLGVPFLDDNVASRDSPIYFSITIGVRILGPVLGFILGSLCTRLYIYPHVTPDYDPTDPRWLGAWWLGMLLISGLLFITSILMYGFPSSLKRGKPKGSPPQSQMHPKLRDFPNTIKRLLTNKILILRTFSCVFHLLPISGLYTFLPKYLESQFRLAAFQANMVTGTAGILVMGIGIFSSGVFIRRKEPSARGIAIWVAGAAGIYALGMVALMFVGCNLGEERIVSDFSIRADQDFGLPNCRTDKCNGCSKSVYSPVCGADNRVYFSPCHAGCSPNTTTTIIDSKKVLYENCSCVGGTDNVETQDLDSHTASSGLCPVSCDLFPLYLTIFMIIVLVHSTSEVGSMLLTLRCVEPRDKAMALGLIQCAIGIFGNVPCPVIYGTVVDSACIVWGSTVNECSPEEHLDPLDTSTRGHCWVYDSTSFRIYFHGTTAVLMFVAFVIDLVVVFHAQNINIGVNENVGVEAKPEVSPLLAIRNGVLHNNAPETTS